MTALVRKTTDSETLSGATSPTALAAGGFDLAATPAAGENNLRRALVTILLVLYPAMATAGVVVAALVFSGARPLV